MPTAKKAYHRDAEERVTFGLAPTDRNKLRDISAAYKKRLGFEVSLSLILAVAIDLLDAEVKRGKLRLLDDSNGSSPDA